MPSFRRTCWADLSAVAEHVDRPFPSMSALLDVLTIPGTWAVLLFRIANLLHGLGLRPLSRLVYFLNVVMFGADLAPGTRVGPGLVLPHPVGVAFSPGARIGRRVRLMGGVRLGAAGHEDPAQDGLPVIGDDCWLFDGAKVFGPVTVGSRTVVGTNAVVTRDMPEDAIVVGNPARVVRRRWDRPGYTGDGPEREGPTGASPPS